MASPCEVLVDGAGADRVLEIARVVAEEIWRIERQWSRYLPGNIVDRINRAQGESVEVDDETSRLLSYAEHLWQISDGLFDITSGIFRRVWRFDGSDRLPDRQSIAALLPSVGWHHVSWRPPVLQMKPGMEIDFGGIGKEYAVDRASELVKAEGEPVLINCGGDLAVTGPRADGRAWLVGIDAKLPGPSLPVIHLQRGAVASSGDTHRYLLKDGVRYSHVLNPKTGWASVGGPRVVTVAASTCSEAGALSTLALLSGPRAETVLKEWGADGHVVW